MSLVRLSVQRLRNLASIEMEPSSEVNLIIGQNGSGKTSILEAIYLLGRGRSFRGSRQAGYICRGESNVTVFGEVEVEEGAAVKVPVGVSKSLNGENQVRIRGEGVSSTAPLAKLLPIQLINPDTFTLLSGGPKNRRQFMDWGVFHVEHSFFESWQRLNRSLKQRNTLLRQGGADRKGKGSFGSLKRSDVSVWDREFVSCAELITEQRSRYIERLQPLFIKLLQELSELEEVSLSFYAGWDTSKELDELLDSAFERDRQLGYTQWGPQRADLRLRYLGQNAHETLSRGQQKLVIAALKIAQGYLLAQTAGNCVYLVDDLAAELDSHHTQTLCQLLAQLNCQLFVTSVEEHVFDDLWGPKAVKVFHVEQGALNKGALIS